MLLGLRGNQLPAEVPRSASRRRFSSIVALCVCICLCGPVRGSQTEDGLAEPDTAAFLRKYCSDCHSGPDPQSGLSLDVAEPLSQFVVSSADRMEAVVRRLETRQMPPADAVQPDDREYEAAVAELIGILDQNSRNTLNPGTPPLIRRLTRTEYGNAIRDLLRIEADVTTLLPPDQSSFGFDNTIVSNLSPAFLNRAVSAAEELSRLAVGGRNADTAQTFRVRPDLTQEGHLPGLPLGTRGGLVRKWTCPSDGEYEVRIRLMRDRNEHVEGLSRRHTVLVVLNDAPVAQFEVDRPKTDTEHQTADIHLRTRIKIPAGNQRLGVTFLRQPAGLIETRRQPRDAHFNFHRHPRQSPAIYEVSITGPVKPVDSQPVDSQPVDSQPVDSQPVDSQPVDSQPGEPLHDVRLSWTDDVAADSLEDAAALTRTGEQLIRDLARRAFRKPLTDDDVGEPLRFFHEEMARGGFESALQTAVAAILVNPQFLLRVEASSPDVASGDHYPVSAVDLASRLSFFLWSSIPDEELLRLAEDGTLRDEEVLRCQVRRMLEDDRSSALVTNFAAQWLYLRNLDSVTPDGRLFPDFDHNLRTAMQQETQLFLRHIIEQDLPVTELLSADYSFLNERLAVHYDLPHIRGSRFRRVDFSRHLKGEAEGSDPGRGGLLRHASVLTVSSYADRTSPVLRGHWILKNILGSPPPPPPDQVPALPENSVDATLTVRARLAAHRADPACAHCHNLMDPLGFALEHYDATGRWRMTDGGEPIDSSGILTDGTQFDGVEQLEEALLRRPETFVRTVTEKLMVWGSGRGLTASDAPLVRNIVRNAAQTNYRFSSLVTEIVLSPAFLRRTQQ